VTAVRRDGAAEGGRLDRVVQIGLGTPQPFPASGGETDGPILCRGRPMVVPVTALRGEMG